MKITGLPLTSFEWCVSQVSRQTYGGNVVVHGDSDDLDTAWRACRARLTVRDSHGPGSRISASRRHGPWACWHAYRDVLILVFERYPDAVVTAGVAWRVTYRGIEGFRELYPGTGRKNVGSQLDPVTMPELCDCGYSIVAPIQREPLVLGDIRRLRGRQRMAPDYVSPAVIHASEAMARSAELLADKPLDPYVFGPEYDVRDDPQSVRHDERRD